MVDAISRLTPVPAAPSDLPPASQPIRDQVKKEEEPEASPAVKAVETMLRSREPPMMGRDERLNIQRDDVTGTFVYRSISKDTGEVLNQWPAEAMLQFKAYLKEAQGVIFDAEV